MTPVLSTYLNMLRVFAAMEVFLSHLCLFHKDCGFAGRFSLLGSDGVVIFFVLSGYVIAYTADQKDRTARNYFINRCARIYSVVLPALLLSLAIEWIGIQWFPSLYNDTFDHYQFAKLYLYVPLWLSFSSELWSLNEPIMTNGAFWSLCFEVWFYIAFAIALFMRGSPRIIAIIVVALIVGPKTCLLFPLWGLGVLIYRIQKTRTLAPRKARALLLLSLGAYLLLKIYDLDTAAAETVDAGLAHWPRSHLQEAWHLPGYLLIALCVAGSILAVRFAAFDRMAWLAAPVGLVASFTFTIYLLHLPLLKFFAALGGTAIDTILLPMFATLLTVVLVGVCTEWRVRSWRSAFTRVVRVAEKLTGRAVTIIRGGD